MPSDNQLEQYAEEAERRACRHCDHNGWRILHTEDGYERVGRCLHADPEIQDIGYETVKRTHAHDPVKAGQIAGYENVGVRFPVRRRPTTQTSTTENTP